MNNPEIPAIEEENQRLRAVIAGLEERTRAHERQEPLRNQATGELPPSLLQYKEIFDNTPVCLFLIEVTPDGRFKLAAINRAEEQVLGLSNDKVSGKFIEDILSKELADHVSANYRRCLKAGLAIHFDDNLDLPGGQYWHTNLIPLRNADGVINRIIGSCIDITDLKRAQEEALAKQNLESLGTLASGIAHDFNNILGAVRAQAEVAIAELSPGSRVQDELKTICEVAMRGSEIVRELMIYAGKDSEAPGLVDLSEIVEGMLALLKVSISKHAILKTDFDKPLPPVRAANAAQISQIVMNLVANASEAIGDREGTIHVTARHVTVGPDSPEIDRLAEGEYLQLEVSDTGLGMSPETRARVFDPFFTTKSAGRGLGLSVVQGIVRALGGAIQLASELGRGTTFLILLPCAETASGTTKRGSISEIGQQDRPSQAATVLVVEDEDALRQAASKMLQKRGFSVIEARDGSAALDAIRALENPIDVLFLDVTLPGIPSRVVLEEARRLKPQMRVVVTSAYSEEMAAASLQTTIEHFIRKPYGLNDLVGLIQPKPSSASHHWNAAD